MSPKQPSKDKRAAQNRNQRAARAARAANAKAGSVAERSTSTTKGSMFSRLLGGGAPRTAPRSRMTAAEARSLQPPGLRAALSGVFAALAAILLCTFMLPVSVDANGDIYSGPTLVADWVATTLDAAAEQPDASADDLADSIDEWTPGREEKPAVEGLWPMSAAIVLPLGGAGLALWTVRKRMPSRNVNRALYATLFGAILTQTFLPLFLPTVIAVGVAMFQVRRAETMAAAMAAGDREDTGPGDDDVIDVEEVEDTAPDEVDAE